MQSDYRPFDRPAPGTTAVLHIATGVFLGALAASLVIWIAFELRIQWEAQQAARMLQDQARQVQRQVDQAQERQRQQLMADQAAKQQATRAAAAQQRAEEDAKRATLLERNRRDDAWARFHKPSPGCALTGQSIDCANEFIRAKRAFDQQYSAGQL